MEGGNLVGSHAQLVGGAHWHGARGGTAMGCQAKTKRREVDGSHRREAHRHATRPIGHTGRLREPVRARARDRGPARRRKTRRGGVGVEEVKVEEVGCTPLWAHSRMRRLPQGWTKFKTPIKAQQRVPEPNEQTHKRK